MELKGKYVEMEHKNDGMVADGIYSHLMVHHPVPGVDESSREMKKAIMRFKRANPALAMRSGNYGPDCDHEAVIAAYGEQGITVVIN